MRLNVDILRAMNPCKEGFRNLLKQHPSFDGSAEEFLHLYDMPLSDRLWAVSQTLPLEDLMNHADLIASEVAGIDTSGTPAEGIEGTTVSELSKAKEVLASGGNNWSVSLHSVAVLLSYTDILFNMGGEDSRRLGEDRLIKDFSTMCLKHHTEE